MCLVQTPYYRLCGHFGRPVVAPHGRCARAEHTPGPCYDPQDIGIKTVESMCISCERMTSIPETEQIVASRDGPVDCHKFNQLVAKLHRRTCDRRRASIASTSSHSTTITSPALLQTADDLAFRRSSIASETSITSSTILQPADDLAVRRPSMASEISVDSTAASTISTEGRQAILTIESPTQTTRIPSRTRVEEWRKQSQEGEHEDSEAPDEQGSQP